MSGTVTVERREAIALITLSNPDRRNALDPPMLGELVRALERLPGEGARACVLTGAGERAFSAGYDLTALPGGEGELPPANHPLEQALRALRDGPLPVVAALNGVAIGGGCELAATCDLRVAHPEVKLAMPPVRLGLVYAPRGLARFVSLIGQSRARELFLTAAPVEATRALDWGLIDRVVPREEVLPAALALAGEMAAGAPLAVAGTRRVLEILLAPPDDAAAAEIAHLQARCWTSEDHREAKRAFAEKRPPLFRGA
jgi:enoyl-CoA hydratase/carnithine racemase